jgi:xylulose-5-phosphate/fructose-6-phosphate phosphoketolase
MWVSMEALAATELLRQHFPDLKVRFINVVDLFRLLPATEHPHGMRDLEFDSLFTADKPMIFNFHLPADQPRPPACARL